MSKIEWTEKTLNPTVGCSRVSDGCKNCYAINQAHRNAAIAQAKINNDQNPGRLAHYIGLTEKRGDRIEWTGQVNFVPEALQDPPKRKVPTTYFVNSMSDLFHPDIPDEWRDQFFAVASLTPHHQYQILTKRPDVMLKYFSKTFGETTHDLDKKKTITRSMVIEAEMMRIPQCPDEALANWPLSNVWLGVSVENQRTADERCAPMRSLAEMGWFTWVSHEPALELVNFSGWEFIKWLVMGGESGPKARRYDLAWPRSVAAWCKASAIAFFHKQLGAYPIGHDGEISIIGKRAMPFGNGAWRRIESSKGNNPDEWPEDLRVREFPEVAT